jgi:hypothetical protein
MTLAATVFGATAKATIGTQFSETLINLVNTLTVTHGWTIISGAYNNGVIGDGGAPTEWTGPTNYWDTVARVSLDHTTTNYRAWIVLENGDSTYLTIYLHTWVDASWCGCNFGMSKMLPTNGFVGSVGTMGSPPCGADSIWAYGNSGGVLTWNQKTYYRHATNTTKQVIWADANSFFTCNVPSGGTRASGFAGMLKLAKTDAMDSMPYVIGTCLSAQEIAGYYLRPTETTYPFNGATSYPANMGYATAYYAHGLMMYPSYVCISAVVAAAQWSNNSVAILQDVDGNKMEWEIQVWTELGSTTSRFRRGVLSDIRLCCMTSGAPNTDGTLNTGSTRISVGEWSFPWSGALTWPAP